MEPLSSNPLDTQDQSQATWLQLMTSWQQQYATWNVYAQQQNAVNVPQTTSRDILGGLLPDENSSSVRSNGRGWSSLVMDWSIGHAAYNNSALCRAA